MKRYFINSGLKISTAVLLLLMTLFLLITCLCLKTHNDNLKADYIKSLGAISARVVEKNPEMEKEIIPLITKEVSKEEATRGSVFLKQYGLTESVEDELFPYVNRAIVKNNYSIILIFIIMAAILFTLNYFQYGFFYKRIRSLTFAAKKVVEGDYDIAINENKEGDFSKLANSFNFMREIIRSNLSELRREKQFLVELLSDISHQLKTPLSSVILYNDIMITKQLPSKQREDFLLNNQNQLEKMNWLIKNILKLAKLDAKAIEIVKEKQSLNETLQDAIDALESKAYDAQVVIDFKEKEEIDFKHDRLWLEEALINIIKNGIEHTPRGGTIDLELLENPLYTRITIEDTGEGINEADLPNIFKRFYKAKTSKKSDSIGIGLALSKSIVEAHNGMIEVRSKVEVGTRFIITFVKG
ncbi:HAMP domain-containing histidine kinase [Clostridium tagluense]|uniref:HAMP domain-containing sensor histidine kinase n=1 Tax=Clostridium tagluense TaxID=360422 RepID=UPI001C0B13EC|nr:HAMP domain-containing sensor histidine kinase [Clostridium tagluense]MBU3128360.1 HAMP domain-containing histidine kinase [Clostridium tagluense]MCB2313823.1 HAMP domain-containing histidine kinase [Clostridium tagluense]MCB2318627.1 HAMP domain-containing histidine kinase [Clostridium tagluense]MCB2323502.1 HAMP domain-containing histidine kinase [Clostridium tagluense]MCB2328371.1 HAMP domain-containing histidine kinase [Clostridium tagluense]